LGFPWRAPGKQFGLFGSRGDHPAVWIVPPPPRNYHSKFSPTCLAAGIWGQGLSTEYIFMNQCFHLPTFPGCLGPTGLFGLCKLGLKVRFSFYGLPGVDGSRVFFLGSRGDPFLALFPGTGKNSFFTIDMPPPPSVSSQKKTRVLPSSWSSIPFPRFAPLGGGFSGGLFFCIHECLSPFTPPCLWLSRLGAISSPSFVCWGEEILCLFFFFPNDKAILICFPTLPGSGAQPPAVLPLAPFWSPQVLGKDLSYFFFFSQMEGAIRLLGFFTWMSPPKSL